MQTPANDLTRCCDLVDTIQYRMDIETTPEDTKELAEQVERIKEIAERIGEVKAVLVRMAKRLYKEGVRQHKLARSRE